MANSVTATQPTNEDARPKRAIIFARTRSVPVDPERDEAQLRAQMQACREVATRLGAEVVSEHWAVAGSSELGTRIVIEGMLEEIANCEVDYLIVQNLDRLARKPHELIRIGLRLKHAGAQLVTMDGPDSSFLQAVFGAHSVAITFDDERSSA
jgi:DNA invertase Pin-like site-specific DNA recombinase